MGRAPCCDKANVKRGPWSPEEDTTLKNYVETYGSGGNWIALPYKAGLKRCGKSCRLRWLNYLRPDIKHGGFTEEEDNIICSLYNSIGSRWSVIASRLPGRTDNDVKNYWNTKLKKKLFAGKTSRDINNNNSITTNNNIRLSSTTSSPASLTKGETDSIQACVDSNSAQLPLSSEVGFGQNMDSQRWVPSQIHFPLPGLMDTSMDNSYSVSSSSQEASGISVSASCSLALANNYVSWSDNGGGEAYGLPMDFGFGSPFDLFNGFGFQEKSSEAVPNLANSLYADHLLADGSDTKPSGLYQSIIN